ncbi:hypothetical protein GF314_07215, partial [bacterium]|nr:hypothetical protein [bacterium]
MKVNSIASVFLASLLLISVLLAGPAPAHPVHGMPIEVRQPDGTVVPLSIWGDEYHQRLETRDGYTVVRDPRDDRYCYAELSSDGRTLRSTGVGAD